MGDLGLDCNIKMVLIEIGCEDVGSIYLAQDIVHWRVLVNTVINLRSSLYFDGNIKFLEPYPVVAADTRLEIGTALISAVLSQTNTSCVPKFCYHLIIPR